MSNLNKIKEEGTIEFDELFPGPIMFKTNILDWHNKRIDKAYSLAIDEVVKEIEDFKDSYEPNLSYQDPLFREAQTAGENSLIELSDTIKTKLQAKE